MNAKLGRSVRLFLAEGTASGLTTAEIMNWTGHVITGSRSGLPVFLKRTELDRTGVYFLTGPDPKDPDTCNLFALYKLFADEAEEKAMAARYRAGGLGYSEVKNDLFERIQSHYAPFRKKREELQKDAGYVDSVLQGGAKRARSEALATLAKARHAVGLE